MKHFADTVPLPTIEELAAKLNGWQPDEKNFDMVMRAIHHGSIGRREGRDVLIEWAKQWPEGPTAAEIEDLWFKIREPVIPHFWLDSANSPLATLPRMSIEIETGDTTHTMETLAALIADTSPITKIVVLNGRMGQLYLRQRPGLKGEPVQSLEFNPLTRGALAATLDTLASFKRLSKGKNGSTREIVTDCPRGMIGELLEMPNLWLRFGIPHVDCITETPIFADCRLIASTGLCLEASAFVNAPAGVRIPPDVNREHAEAALARILEWLAEFPFETPTDQAVAVSLLLTAALRASLQPIPAFLIDKPTFGSGASTLASLAHIVMTGRRPAVLSADRGQDEIGKQIDAAQMAGVSAIFIDNIPEGSEFKSESLAQSITESERKPRILGESENKTVQSNQLFVLNGKNVTVAADLMRRFLVCRLNPMGQRLQDRQFKRPKLLDEAALPSARVALLTDLYTVAAAYCRTGSDVASAGLLGFEDWSHLCAGSLVWLGLPDPSMSNEKLERDDPETQDFHENMALWEQVHGNAALKVDDLLRMDNVFDGPPLQLAEKLKLAAGVNHRTENPARVVGKYLRRFMDNSTASGKRLQRVGTSEGRAVWAVR